MRFLLLFPMLVLALSVRAQVKIPSNLTKAASGLLPKTAASLTETEVADGLKEALVQGVKSGSDGLGAAGGFAKSEMPKSTPIPSCVRP
jgi:hypothetical protein